MTGNAKFEDTMLEFLRARIKEVEKRVAATEDYKELKVLRKMLADLSPKITISAREPEENVEVEAKVKAQEYVPLHFPKPAVKSARRSSGHDLDNSPLVSIAFGGRMRYIYEKVEDLVKQSGGSMSLDDITEYLKLEYNLEFTSERTVANYINLFNSNPSTEDEATLECFPKPAAGKIKVKKYTSVVYVGKERLKNAK